MAHASEQAGQPKRGGWGRWRRTLVATWREAGEDDLSLVAAGVAFYGFLAVVPLLTALVLSYGLVAEPAAVVHHVRTLTAIMPASAAAIIGSQLEAMVSGSDSRTGLALLGAMALALYGASKGAAAIITALNIVYEVEEQRGLVARTLAALTIAGGAVTALLLAVAAVSAMNLLEALLPALGGFSQLLVKALSFLAAAAAVALLLALIYRYAPNRPEAAWRWITPGSALATIVWLAATLGFGAYVSNFGNYNATYGSLGAVIVFLTWLYLTAYVVLLGAELNAMLELRPDARAAPADEGAPAGDAARPPSLLGLAARMAGLSAAVALLGRRRRASPLDRRRGMRQR